MLRRIREVVPINEKDPGSIISPAAMMKKLLPKRIGSHARGGPPPPLVKAQELPAAPALSTDDAQAGAQWGGTARQARSDVEEDSDEDDFAERPLKFGELQTRAVHSAAQRKRRRGTHRHGGADKDADMDRGPSERFGMPATQSITGGGTSGGEDGGETSGNEAPAEPVSPLSMTNKRSVRLADEATEFGDTPPGSPDGSQSVPRSIYRGTRPSRDDGDDQDDNEYASDLSVTAHWRKTRSNLDPNELEDFLSRYRMNQDELQVIVDRLGIHLSHLCNLKREFDAFDPELSGYIDVKRVRALLLKLAPEDMSEDNIEEAQVELDAESSGEVEFFEFVECSWPR